MTELEGTAARVAGKLIARRETIAISESSSGGLISAALLAVPGASAFFMGGAVVYTLKAREVLLGITAAEMKVRGSRSASEPYAALCAKSVRVRFGTVWGLSETGAAGPTGNSYGDAAGHACFAVDGPAVRVTTLETGHGDRPANMRIFAVAALELLDKELG